MVCRAGSESSSGVRRDVGKVAIAAGCVIVRGDMALGTLLVLLSLAAAVLLLAKRESPTWSAVAAIASLIALARRFGWLTFAMAGFDAASILGAGLLLAGGFLYAPSSGRLRVVAATLILLAGAVLLLGAFGVVRG